MFILTDAFSTNLENLIIQFSINQAKVILTEVHTNIPIELDIGYDAFLDSITSALRAGRPYVDFRKQDRINERQS